MLPSSSDLAAKLIAAKADDDPDDRSPLLIHRRSRARFVDGRETPRARLSRHHSATGKPRLLDLIPTILDIC